MRVTPHTPARRSHVRLTAALVAVVTACWGLAGVGPASAAPAIATATLASTTATLTPAVTTPATTHHATTHHAKPDHHHHWGVLTGTVVTPTGHAVRGATVAALDPGTGRVLRSVATTATGRFVLGRVRAGDVVVRVTKPGWLPTYAHDATSFETADVVAVRRGHPLVLGRLTLVRGAAVEGQVLGRMDPLSEATVTVYDATTGAALASAPASGDGYYRIAGLRPGPVIVGATREGWLPAWADNASSAAQARVFTLVAGQTLTQSWSPMRLYIDLMPESAIEGQVLAWMDPIGGATVTVYDAATGTPLASVPADGDGYYRVGGLPPGDVKVGATKDGYAPAFANGGTSLATADVFRLEMGQTLSQGWDPLVLYLDLGPLLVPTASVTASVLSICDDPEFGVDDPIAGVGVELVALPAGTTLQTGTTDELGEVHFGDLPAGDYLLRASREGWLTVESEPFTLAVGEHAGRWLTIWSMPAVTGQVLGQMDPLGQATVTVYDATTRAPLASTVTDGDGYYRINGLLPGPVVVGATREGWLPGWADGAPTAAGATVYTLAPGQTLRQLWDPVVLYLDLLRVPEPTS